jgi:hypothetical protein
LQNKIYFYGAIFNKYALMSIGWETVFSFAFYQMQTNSSHPSAVVGEENNRD